MFGFVRYRLVGHEGCNLGREVSESDMIKLILLSSSVVWNPETKSIRTEVLDALKVANGSKVQINLVSIGPKPAWIEKTDGAVGFFGCEAMDRKSGRFIDRLIEHNRKADLKKSEILILGAKDADFYMAVNSQTLLVCAGWVPDLEAKLTSYGVRIDTPDSINLVLKLLRSKQPWYFQSDAQAQKTFALTNAGTIGVTDRPTLNAIEELKSCLKDGLQKRKSAFNVHLLSSLNVTDEFRKAKWWGWYPSSESSNSVMEDFATLARQTFKKRTRGPIFIRHRPTQKRHTQRGGDRSDPSRQLETIHINPEYEGRLKGEAVVILDDYLTYGLSFGVANAMLRKAGATDVICVAMGKFGNRAHLYNIDISGDVFKPLSKNDSRLIRIDSLPGEVEEKAQLQFVEKFATSIR